MSVAFKLPAGAGKQANEADPVYEGIVAAEVAVELLNNARGIIQARANELRGANPREADRLMQRAGELYQQQRRLRIGDSQQIEEIKKVWGPRLRDERRFWREF